MMKTININFIHPHKADPDWICIKNLWIRRDQVESITYGDQGFVSDITIHTKSGKNHDFEVEHQSQCHVIAKYIFELVTRKSN